MDTKLAWFLVVLNIAAGLINIGVMVMGLLVNVNGEPTIWTVLNVMVAAINFTVALWIYTMHIYKP